MISLNDVLLAASNIPVDDPIAEIWGRGLQGGYKIIEYTGALPIAINANGDVLLDYRIYGADGGVGEPTENLFNRNTITPNSLINDTTGEVEYYPYYDTTAIMEIENDFVITFVKGVPSGYLTLRIAFYDAQNSFISHQHIRDADGLAAPTTYIPYGYKLPMTVSGGNTVQNVPVYIGDTPLEEDEYVDFEEQKVYKRTENLFNGRGENNYGYYDNANGRFIDDENYKHWKFSVEEGDVIRWTKTGAGWGCYWSKGVYRGRLWGTNNPFTVPAEVDEITNNFDSSVWDSAMVTKNQPLPADYVPYLQPTDPPVPLPEIPTIDGETLIDYDGTPKPSQMYVKYKGKGAQ